MAKVLVVEDDGLMQEALEDFLRSENHIVEIAANAREALDCIKFYYYDLVILDWELPGGSGLDVLTQTRHTLASCPVLMLTGRTAESDRVAGFESGADDYLCKPFNMRELRVRVQALLRRPPLPDAAAVPDAVRYKLDGSDWSLMRTDTNSKLRLLPKEFAIMELLMAHRGSFVAVETIANSIWHAELEQCEEAIRTCIKRMRQRIKADWDVDSLIESKRGLGYRVNG